jgi:hypothetical protein
MGQDRDHPIDRSISPTGYSNVLTRSVTFALSAGGVRGVAWRVMKL